MSTNESTAPRRPRGKNDPDRRERIAKAAIAVVAERGIQGLTHRTAAAAAGVPLGSTTYHFATLDELLAAAVTDAATSNVGHLRDWESALPADADFAAALADLTLTFLVTERARTIVEFELYVAALHRPSLRPAATAWDDAMMHVFSARTDPVTGRLLSATFCGLLLQATLSATPPTRAEAQALFRRALADTPH